MNFCPNGMTVYSSHELTVFEPRQQQNCDGIITNQSENKSLEYSSKGSMRSFKSF